MTDIPPKPMVTFLDNPLAPDIFADAAVGWLNHNGNVRITFEAARVNHETSPGPVNRVVIGRLVMPIDSVEAMARGLLEFISQQRAAASGNQQGTPTIN